MSASKLQMKKNNIMALAAHAVNNQEKLDEMFAAHKKTRREAATKYGKCVCVCACMDCQLIFNNMIRFLTNDTNDIINKKGVKKTKKKGEKLDFSYISILPFFFFLFLFFFILCCFMIFL